MKIFTLLAAGSLAVASAQQIGQYTPEQHPPLPIQSCTKAGGCKTESTSVVIDAAWRWLHKVNDYTPCLSNSKWIPELCPDPKTCAQNCAYEGVTVSDYQNNYGVSVSGDEVTLQYSDKFGARLYFMANDDKYRMFHLLNQEFTFDVDESLMECGMNGGLYLISMPEDGGSSQYPTNKAGARYGTGYCDAQCPSNSFMNGQANFGAPTSTGMWGQCCAEFDFLEGNKNSEVVTSHPSTKPDQYNCTNDVDCGFGNDNFYKSIVDKGGCGFNAYPNGNKAYWGAGSNYTIDTTKKVTVITQFITDDHTANGKLVEIRRLYKQNGKVYANSKDTTTSDDSITDAYCKAKAWGTDYHLQHGGLTAMGEALGKGMVLSATIWADAGGHMAWLDQGNNGPCPASGGDPAVLQKMGINIKLSNIRVGDIGSTFTGTPETPVPTTTTAAPTTTPAPSTAAPTTTPAPSTAAPTTTPAPSTAAPTTTPAPTTAPPQTVPKWGRCGGIGYTGPTTCSEGTCTKMNDWYSQCV